MQGTTVNQKTKQFIVYFTKYDNAGEVYEAGTILFKNLKHAAMFAKSLRAHPHCSAQVYFASGADYANASQPEDEDELFI